MRVRVALDFDTDLEPGDAESTETLHSLCRSYMLAQFDGLNLDLPDSGIEAFEQCIVEVVTNDGLLAYVVDEGFHGEVELVASHVEIIQYAPDPLDQLADETFCEWRDSEPDQP